MLEIRRPNFFPGQWIDYKDFNRLAEQPDKMLALLCRHLFQGGGIIVDALDEFKVVPLKALSVVIKSGVGLLPSGETLLLGQDLIVDLTPYATSQKMAIVSLAIETKGTDLYTDETDTSIRGFRAESLSPTVLITNEPSARGLEIFRVALDKNSESLRLATREEEWQTGTVSNPGHAAIIDLRSRRNLVPQTYLPASAETMVEARKALYELQSLHRKIVKLYLQEDPFGSESYLTLIHAELLSRPFQPLKSGFLASEFAAKLSLFLELLLNRSSSQRENFDKESLLKSISSLEKMKGREVSPRALPLDGLSEIARHLGDFVRFAEAKFSLMDVVEEALVDFGNRLVEFNDKLVLGGHLFERIDQLNSDDDKRYVLRAENPIGRRIATQFKNGDRLELKGIFFGKGEIAAEIEVRHPDRPLVLVSHQYVRRAGARLQYEMNGKLVADEVVDQNDLSNNWRNKGIVVRPELLVQNKNLLKIRVEKTDLDFGFFDLIAYQSAMDRRGGE